MADISEITVNNTTYEIKDKVSRATVEVIIGTQTAATGAWTGNASFESLKSGQVINYWLPWNGSGNATLNLTLPNGTTTGAKNVYIVNGTRCTTHISGGNFIQMVYLENAIRSGTKYTGWWINAAYNSDTYNRVRYQVSVTAEAAMAVGLVGVFNASHKFIKLSTTPFDITEPILYVGTAYTASALTQTNNYIVFGSAFNLTSTVSGFTGVAGKPVFIKGTISGVMLTPTSDVLTTTVPTTDDGYVYMLLGYMNTTTNAVLSSEHPLFKYADGAFRTYAEAVVAEHFPSTGKFKAGTGAVSANYAVAVGESTVASSVASFAEGSWSHATANYSHAEGESTTASGESSHAEGSSTEASGRCSHAEGSTSSATGDYSHAEGTMTTLASGVGSHAEGSTTTASGSYAHAEGDHTIANHKSQHAFGEFNVADASSAASTARGTYVEIVGGGTSPSVRKNIRTLDWSGNEILAGKLTVGTGPTNNMDVATKQYVDQVFANLINAQGVNF